MLCFTEMAANSHVPADSNLTFEQSFTEGSPVVFQCKGCKSIVGDSCAFVSSDRELEVICVSGRWIFLCDDSSIDLQINVR